MPDKLTLKSLNVAKPLASVVRVVVPLNVPVPLLNVIATDTPLVETLFPQASRDSNTPDRGYYYDPIDYLFDTVTISKGETHLLRDLDLLEMFIC